MAEPSESSTSTESSAPSSPSLVEYLDITYRMFGQDEPADMELPNLPKMHLAQPGIDEYTNASEGLIRVADAYESVQQKAWETVVKTKEMSKTGRANVLELIKTINDHAVRATNDVGFFDVLEAGFLSVDGVREASNEKSQELGGNLRKDLEEWKKKSEAQGQKDREAWQKQIDSLLQRPPGTAPPGTPGAPGAPGANNPGQNPPPWLNDNGPKQPGTTPDPTRPGGINPPGTITPPDTKPPASGVKPPISDIKPPTTTPPVSTPPRINPPISSPSSPGLGGMPGMGMPGMGMGMPGMGMPGMGMGLPGMNDQLARRNDLDRDLARRREELEARRDRDKPRDVVPPRSAVQPAVAQQQGPGAPGVANGQQVNANSGATAPGAGTPPPPGQAAGPVPNDKGLVEYDKFKPLGRPSLWVSPVVYGALDAAVANKKGIDAKAAYANTPAKWNDDKKIGLRVDPSQLITGDVVSWKDGTAIAVVWDGVDGGAGAVPAADGAAPAAGAGGKLEIIANGELQALTGDIMKMDGPYGEFIGFFHPNGIDAVPSTDAGAAAPVPATADQQPTVVA